MYVYCPLLVPAYKRPAILTIPTDTAVILGDFRNRHPECHSKWPQLRLPCLLPLKSMVNGFPPQLWQICVVCFGGVLVENWSAYKFLWPKFLSQLPELSPSPRHSMRFRTMVHALSSSVLSLLY